MSVPCCHAPPPPPDSHRPTGAEGRWAAGLARKRIRRLLHLQQLSNGQTVTIAAGDLRLSHLHLTKQARAALRMQPAALLRVSTLLRSFAMTTQTVKQRGLGQKQTLVAVAAVRLLQLQQHRQQDMGRLAQQARTALLMTQGAWKVSRLRRCSTHHQSSKLTLISSAAPAA